MGVDKQTIISAANNDKFFLLSAPPFPLFYRYCTARNSTAEVVITGILISPLSVVCALGRDHFVDIIYWIKKVPFVLVFYCCATNCSKQHISIISVSMGQGYSHSLTGSFVLSLTGKIILLASLQSHPEAQLGKDHFSKLIQTVDRIHSFI